jgi:DNA-binding NarL/FixJ family response regulator
MITIFLADDHTIVRDGLGSLLRAQPDLEVIGDAENGREALRQMAQQCPDVAILDISMPELNGIETTRQLRELCPTTQVIILSMHASSSYIFRALQAGARGYLLKAAAGREVADAVRTVAAGHRYLGQEISDTVIDDYIRQPEAARGQDPLKLLSPREREIFQLVVEGKSSPEIAEVLFISPKTVDTYRSRLMQKLNISDLPSLVKFAIRHGLASLE